MGEAVYLHKPMLAIPLDGQFEQIINARYLQYDGYGQHAEGLDSETVADFLAKVPQYAKRLATYTQDGNRDLLDAVDHHLDRAAAELI